MWSRKEPVSPAGLVARTVVSLSRKCVVVMVKVEKSEHTLNGSSSLVCAGLKKKQQTTSNCTAAHQQGAIRLLWVLFLYFWAVVRLDEQNNR